MIIYVMINKIIGLMIFLIIFLVFLVEDEEVNGWFIKKKKKKGVSRV